MVRAPSVRSIAPPAGAAAASDPHHHSHTRKHYERSVLDDGTIREKTVTEQVYTPTTAHQQLAQAHVVAAARVDPKGGAHVAVVEGGAQAGNNSNKKKNKKKKKTATATIVGGHAATVEDAPDSDDDDNDHRGPAEVVEVIGPHDSISVVRSGPHKTDVEVVPVPTTVVGGPAQPHQPPEVTVTATVRIPTPPQHVVEEVTPRAAPRPLSVVAPTAVRAVSRPPTVVHANPRPPTVFAPPPPAPFIAPPSPAPSHRSHKSSHHHRSSYHQPVPVIVNVTIPQQATAAAPAAAAAPEPIAPILQTPAPRAASLFEPTPLAQTLALPPPVSRAAAPSVLDSPHSVRSMRLPSILKPSKAAAPAETPRVISQTVEELDQSPLGDDLIETKVVTTTTTTRRGGTPPRKTPSPPSQATMYGATPAPVRHDFTQYVEAVPLSRSWEVAPPAAPAARSVAAPVAPPASVRVGRPAISAPPTPPMTPEDGADKQSIPIHINVNITNPNAAAEEHRSLRPIPFIDYSSLIRRSPPKKEKILALPPPTQTLPAPTTTMMSLSPSTNRLAPPTTIPSQAPLPIAPTVRPPGTTIMQTPGRHAAAPQTVMSMSMDLDRDSQGHEHLHATMRDHTGKNQNQNMVQGLGLDTGMGAGGLPNGFMDPNHGRTPMIGGGGGRLDTDMRTHIDLPSFGLSHHHKETKEEKHERKMREKQAKREEKEREKREREPIYKPIGGAAPPPRSLRYAAPPGGAAEIERKIRERFEKKVNPPAGSGPQPPYPTIGMPPPWLGPGGRTMPLMGQRPPMFGPPMAPWMVAPLIAGGSGLGVPGPGMMGSPPPGMLPGMAMGMGMGMAPGMGMGMGMGMGPPGMGSRFMPGQMGYGGMGPGGYARSAAGVGR